MVYSLEGCFDGVFGLELHGWAWNPSLPQERVNILIADKGTILATHTADGYREDLEAAGIGDGLHRFQIPLPDVLFDNDVAEISIFASRKEGGGLYELSGSPCVIEVHNFRSKIDRSSMTLKERIGSYGINSAIDNKIYFESVARRIARDLEVIADKFGNIIALSFLYSYILQRQIDNHGLKTRQEEMKKKNFSFYPVVVGVMSSEEFLCGKNPPPALPYDHSYPLKAWI